jgi:transglutaminase-like putative cysteine protease
VTAPTFEISRQHDAFGNTVLNLSIPHVEKAIDFEAWIVVERHASKGPHRISPSWLSDPRFLEPSRLTQPDDTLRDVATMLMGEGHQGIALAQRINDWVYHALRYAHGITDIHTAAAEALALGQGVCQDYAHVMITLCRLCGLPARYVSGHLLGEGGTHAWVEVLLPSTDRPNEAIALPFDPTHGCEANLSYVTIAVGRDYFDVAPTSGTFRASYRGRLSARKRVGLTDLEYADTA